MGQQGKADKKETFKEGRRTNFLATVGNGREKNTMFKMLLGGL